MPSNVPVLVTVTDPFGVWFDAVARGIGRRVLLDEAGQPEVHDAHGSVLAHHHVVRLEVAMHDFGGVRGRQTAPGREEHVHDVAPGSWDGAEPGGDRLAFHELHRDVDANTERARVVYGDDVRVRQPRDRPGLAQQPRPALGAVGAGFVDDLEGDATLEIRVIGGVHLAHPAASDQPEDPVTAYVRSDRELAEERPPLLSRLVPAIKEIGCRPGGQVLARGAPPR